MIRPSPLFIKPMRAAIREDRKRQTRRVVRSRHWPEQLAEGFEWVLEISAPGEVCVGAAHRDTGESAFHSYIRAPHGQPGDIWYLREPWHLCGADIGGRPHTEVIFRDDSEACSACGKPVKWKSAMFMPRWAARTYRYIEATRMERLQEISEADCVAEGLAELQGGVRSEYRCLWDSINAAHPWDSNPWVWVYTFRPATAEEVQAAKESK